MEASVSFHHKSFTQIGIHSKQQQVEVPLINVFFMLVPVLNAPEKVSTLKYSVHSLTEMRVYTQRIGFRLVSNNYFRISKRRLT